MTESTELRQLVEDLPRRPIVPTSPGDPDQLEVIEVAKNPLLQLAKRAAIGELVSGVAHEINNPLALIIGYAELLLRDAPNEPTRTRLRLVLDKARLLGVSGFGQFWVREIGVKKLLV